MGAIRKALRRNFADILSRRAATPIMIPIRINSKILLVADTVTDGGVPRT